MNKSDHSSSGRDALHDRAITRWENEGGGTRNATGQSNQPTVVGSVGDAEDVNIRVRLIALENIVVALLAGAPNPSTDLVRDMARHILPRDGASPHRLTIEAAHKMLAMVERAEHYKSGI
jgi:hypothetical protein